MLKIRGDVAPWLALGTVTLLQCSIAYIDLRDLVRAHGGHMALAAWAVSFCTVIVLQFSLSAPGWAGRRRRGVILVAQAGAAFIPLGVLGLDWEGMCSIFMGTALLAVRTPWWRWTALGLLCCGWLTAWLADIASTYTLGLSMALAVPGLAASTVTYLAGLVSRLQWERSLVARGATQEERMRISRDLHDMLAGKLTTVALKGENALRLVKSNKKGTEAELQEILKLTRHALAEVRSLAREYRSVSLGEELQNALALLSSAGVEVTAKGWHTRVTTEISQVLTPILREGLANILRHSQATRCVITLGRHPGAVRFSIANDGAPAARKKPHDRNGSGLSNMAARLSAVGGTLHAERRAPAWFVISVEIPTHGSAPTRPASGIVASLPPQRSAQRPTGYGRQVC